MKSEGFLLHSEELVHPSILTWRYSPFRTLASLIRRLHPSLFSALLLHPLIPSRCNASLWTTSTHLVLGLPTGLVVQKFPFKNKSWSFYPIPRPVTAINIILPRIFQVDQSNKLPSKHWASVWSVMKLSDKTLYASNFIVLYCIVLYCIVLYCIVLYTLSIPLENPGSN